MSILTHTAEKAIALMPTSSRANWRLRLFAITQVPMIFYCRPTMELLDDTTCRVRIPLTRRTRNHFKSMYFGALAVGADVAGGFLAMHHIDRSGHDVGLIFKSFEANFLKRPEADVVFRSTDGAAMRTLVQRAVDTKERVEDIVHIDALTPDISGETPVATFKLMVSLKVREKRDRRGLI